MKQSAFIALSLAAALAVGATAFAEENPMPATRPTVESKLRVHPVVEMAAQPFDLDRVKLLDGPFKDAMERDEKWLLSLDPDRLLSGFRQVAGLEPKAPKYGGWEARGVAGHSLGHYLSACSQMYAATGDAKFKQCVDYIVDQLAECQQANGEGEFKGYLAAFPEGKKIFHEVGAGHIDTAGFDLNGGWVPWYTIHKDMAGLRDAYLLADNARALDVLTKYADWALRLTDKLSPEQIQTMLHAEQGGMNEVSADLYAITGDKKYLRLASHFNHKFVLDPLSKGEDHLAGLHANTQVPKLIGAARQYELTGDPYFKTAADTFWTVVTKDHSYVNGGNSNAEHFGPPDKLSDQLSDTTSETCNTYNMLKLTRHRFEWTADPAAADYFERALYNHILASQNPKTGMVTYYVPLKMGGQRTYSTPDDSFWCCTGTGMENHAKYGAGIYYHTDDSLFVNLFIASQLDWAEKGVTVRQETKFPESNASTLTFKLSDPTAFALKLRRPAWATDGMTVKINGEPQQVDATPGSFATIDRTWKDGDTLEVTMPMSLRTEAMPDNPNRVAVFYGPILMAGLLGNEGELLQQIPVLVTGDKKLTDWIKPVDGQPLTFTTAGVGRPEDVKLVPFYRAYDQHYMVYWDKFTDQQWAQKQAEYRAEQDRQKALAARTIDQFQPGEMQAERDHGFAGEKSRTGDLGGKKWRDAADGGWFSFTMKVLPDAPNDLSLTYWGSDAGDRTFEIQVDGKSIATETLVNKKPGEFLDETYAIPEGLTKGKQQVTVKLQARGGSTAGGIFGARTLRRE